MLFTKIVFAVALGAAWIPTVAGHAQFEQVRIKNLNDYSKTGDPPEKYFRTFIAWITSSCPLKNATLIGFFVRRGNVSPAICKTGFTATCFKILTHIDILSFSGHYDGRSVKLQIPNVNTSRYTDLISDSRGMAYRMSSKNRLSSPWCRHISQPSLT